MVLEILEVDSITLMKAQVGRDKDTREIRFRISEAVLKNFFDCESIRPTTGKMNGLCCDALFLRRDSREGLGIEFNGGSVTCSAMQ